MALNFTPIQFFDGDDPVRVSNPTDPTIDAAYFNSREAYLLAITNEINTLDHYSHLNARADTHTDWTAKDPSLLVTTTNTPPIDDNGNSFNYTASSSSYTCVKRNGGLQGLLPGTDSGASYLCRPLGSKVKRQGMKFGFGPGGDTNAVCSLAMMAWDTDTPIGGTSQSQAHFVIWPAGWAITAVHAGSFISLAAGTFTTPLAQDYSPHTVEICFYGSVLTLVTPDGAITTVNHSYIGSTQGYNACWEFYKNAGNGFDQVIYDCWADTKAMPSDGMSLANSGRLITRAINVTISQPYPPAAIG